eukprot:TRINITY_DN1121_c0_g1_i3.p1 TRINITY_DN1121_c0_g1~~TRINITY_DN1121_c0_g1_i3.p1  ORF type:complete len:329 (+),score=18.97 TRINITY_DN1121_c0_g1_i3:354-1340(+)
MTASDRLPAAAAQSEAEGRKRMSCNGCRVLRKGCSESCILRPCLQWIESAEAQGHATVFVAKFFGRAGLMAFINAVPENQRPALFQSLLYEACGRTVNPVHGAVGLLASGKWSICQAAVETVLRGDSLRSPQLSSTIPTCSSRPSLTCNLRLNSARNSPTVKAGLNSPQTRETVVEMEQYRERPQQHWVGFASPPKVKLEEAAETGYSRSKVYNVLEDLDLLQASEEAQAPRRVRQRLEGKEKVLQTQHRNNNNIRCHSEDDNNAKTAAANLDLTLYCEGMSSSSPLKRRVSSPSLVSVNSEGSVTTSLESGSFAQTSQCNVVLDLFP